MEEMMNKYSKSVTLNHPIAKEHKDCVKTINKIVKNESFHKESQEYRCDYKNICFGEAKAINLDCVAKNLAYEETPASVDMVLGLENNKFLCVELKLNAVKTPPCESKKLTEKRKATENLICGNNDFIVLFCHTDLDIKSKIQNYLNRIERADSKPKHNYKMMFWTILNALIFSIPYLSHFEFSL